MPRPTASLSRALDKSQFKQVAKELLHDRSVSDDLCAFQDRLKSDDVYIGRSVFK